MLAQEELRDEPLGAHCLICVGGCIILPLKRRYEIRVVQKLLDHKDVRTTMIYTHVLNRDVRGERSPANMLQAPKIGALCGSI